MRTRLLLAGLLTLGTAMARADESYSFVVTSTCSGMPFSGLAFVVGMGRRARRKA